MRILKTYARLFVDDLGTALPFYEDLVGAPADLRFGFEQAELAAVGDFLLIAGRPEDTDRYRATVGPIVVDDLDQAITRLTTANAVVIAGPLTSDTGRFAYLRHPDGVTVEYVEWSQHIRGRVFG
ncbi:glyoxalase-like domain-containing protein [Nocardia nova SH22a]|uniref:Glyoxalase-like domain-containing protein n=1 Tax=Nocardia nova SH22a TaxID=1415166 RepID=W5TC94_9NOCA|nr:VOC family protein [Nocardia nova]AHH16847.1 glyoxalase-like domain-containing protein [Nocardia nova SH22a]